MKTFDVKISCITDLTALVEVKAETPEEAAKLAVTMGETAEWEFPDSKGPFPMAGTEEAFIVYDDKMDEVLELPRATPEEYVRARAATAMLREAVDAWPAFDTDIGADPETGEGADNDVNGGDMVEWFAEWRARVKTMLAEAHPQQAPAARISVIVARYEHKHGFDTRAFFTPEDAELWRQAVAAESWHEIMTTEPPADAKELADAYFHRASELGDEFFTTEQCDVR